MKALVYEGIGKLELEDIPFQGGDIEIRVLGCGICGTDLKTFLNGHHMFPPHSILGHEFYGEVAKCPEGLGLVPGDIVTAAPYFECGHCPACEAGLGEMCARKHYVSTGAFCERISVGRDYIDGIFKIPKSLDEDLRKAFVLTEPLACVLNGIGHLNLRDRSRVLVAGGGPMGMLFAYSLAQKGRPVTVAEPNPRRRGFLLEKGFDAIEPGKADASAYDNAVIAVNNGELVGDYARRIADGGRILVFSGLGKGTELRIDAHSIHYRQVSVTGSSGFALEHFRAAFRLIAQNPARYRSLVTHQFPLERGPEAFELLRKGEALKTILVP